MLTPLYNQLRDTTMTNRLHTDDLIGWFREGMKPKSEWGIGTEQEQFLYSRATLRRLEYDNHPGILQVLQEIESRGWSPVYEKENLIALSQNGASITLEPGGQFELSGRNFKTIHQTFKETKAHCELITSLGKEMGFYNLPIGFDPLWRRDDIPWMPKERYRYMREWMPKKGTLGLDMMTRTSSTQVNLDFESEADMVVKARVAQAFQPVVMALFANSPFTERKPNGYKSYRSHIWDNTDSERCGFLSFIFDDDFGFSRWVEYLLDVPMYFIYRNDNYSSAQGMTFRQYMNNRDYNATIDDWEVHVSTVFPDIRLKKFLELRGADAANVRVTTSLAALWVGLFYDSISLAEAYEIAMNMGAENIEGLRAQVPVHGLDAVYNNFKLKDIAADILKLSHEGLVRRAQEMGIESEEGYLEPLDAILKAGKSTAAQYLELYNNEWNGDVTQIFNGR